jgi:hypothetical protein
MEEGTHAAPAATSAGLGPLPWSLAEERGSDGGNALTHPLAAAVAVATEVRAATAEEVAAARERATTREDRPPHTVQHVCALCVLCLWPVGIM